MKRRAPLLTAFLLASTVAGAQAKSCPANDTDPSAIFVTADGTLYHPGDLKSTGIPSLSQAHFKTIADLLKREGVQLVLVPIPVKGAVAGASGLPATFDAQKARTAYLNFIKTMNGQGIPAVNVLAAADKTPGFYLKYDWHFSPEGAKASAAATHEVLRKLPAYSKLPRRTVATKPTALKDVGGSPADLLYKRCGGTYPLQKVQFYQTDVQEVGDLLDDVPPADVVLVGSSFSEQAQWNFDGFLKQELQTDVLKQSVIAGGLHAAIISYVMSPAFKEHRPKVLLWEFPVNSVEETPEGLSQWNQLISALQPACPKPLVLPAQAVKNGLEIRLPQPQPAGPYDITAEFSDRSTRYWLLHPNNDPKQANLVFRNHYQVNDGRFTIRVPFKTETRFLTLWNLGDKGQVKLTVCRR